MSFGGGANPVIIRSKYLFGGRNILAGYKMPAVVDLPTGTCIPSACTIVAWINSLRRILNYQLRRTVTLLETEAVYDNGSARRGDNRRGFAP
jgi:hypothetical protein